jgi:hypothetical protein
MILKDRDVLRHRSRSKISSKCKKMKMLQFWLIALYFALFSIFLFVMILTILA